MKNHPDNPPTDEEIETIARASWATEIHATGNPSDDDETIRVRRIQAMAADLADNPEVAALRARAIAGELTLPQLCSELVPHFRAGQPNAATFTRRRSAADNRSSDNAVIESALLAHLGHESLAVKTLGEGAAQRARDLRCRSILDIAERALDMNRIELPNGRDQLIRAAFAPAIHAGGGFSTVNLPGILSNATGKILLDAYMQFPSAARKIAKRLSATSFKTQTAYRLASDSTLQKLGSAGEIKHGKLDEASFPFKVDTYARMFSVSRQNIIDDDLAALSSIPSQIGRGGAQALESVFWQLVLSNPSSFFHANNGNFDSGAGTALSYPALVSAVALMMKQVDQYNEPVAVMPKFLVVPPELASVADELFASLNLMVGGGDGTDGKQPSGNPLANKYTPIVAPHISTSNYSGATSTQYYLVADPGDVAFAGIAFLNGAEAPVVETAQADFERLGIQMRGYLDFGCALIDARGAVKVAGA